MSLESWLAFVSIAFIAAAVPGPAILLVTTHSLQFGVIRSLFTVAGNVSGLFTMSACSILGLSALVMVSATAFTVIKIVGALYLLYMGLKLWRNGVSINQADVDSQQSFSAWRLYTQGLLISLTNPKAIVFTSALFPQFINVTEPLLPQFLLLVATLMACSFICLSSYSLLSQRVKNSAGKLVSGKIIGRVFGSTFVCAGAALASTAQR